MWEDPVRQLIGRLKNTSSRNAPNVELRIVTVTCGKEIGNNKHREENRKVE
jgi:hypothetical protein